MCGTIRRAARCNWNDADDEMVEEQPAEWERERECVLAWICETEEAAVHYTFTRQQMSPIQSS